MASNGYVRRQCTKCIFYRTDREYGEECILYDEMWDADGMQWVSATLYETDTKVKTKHDERCEHFVDEKEMRNLMRRKFGIKEVE